MEKYLKEGKTLKFKCVIYPREDSSHRPDQVIIPYGIREDVVFLKHTPKYLGMGIMEMNFGVVINKKEGTIRHNYGGCFGHGKKYTRLDFGSSGIYAIDLFIEIPKSEIPK